MKLEFINNCSNLIMQFFELAVPEMGYFSPACLFISDFKDIDNLATAVQLVVDNLGF